MAVLYVKAGPTSLTLTRNLKYKISANKHTSTGDGATKIYSGRTRLTGTVVIEDEADAIAALALAAADAAFVVRHADGTDKSHTLKGLKFFELDAEYKDGSNDDQVVGFELGFEGELASGDEASDALAIAVIP